MDLQETRQLLTEYAIRPTRSLGQNFLIDDRVVDRMREGVELTQNDFLLEIGPGLGSLTRELSTAKAVAAVEIDRHMVEVLSATLTEFNNISIIHADALKTDFCGLAEGHDSVKVAANLPYYITTQLIEKLLIELARSKLMLLMMQKEAADRLFALPGNKLYGPVSVLVSLYGKAMKYQKVSASSYYPRPHVDSVVIKLINKLWSDTNNLEKETDGLASLNLISRQNFHKFLNVCFSQRRKTFANVIRNSKYGQLVSEGILTSMIEKYGLTNSARAEEIAPQMFWELFIQLQL